MKLSTFLMASILVLASTRGALVYHFGTQPALTYAMSAAALMLLGLYATWRMMQSRIHPDLCTVKKALLLNTMLIGSYTILFMVISFTSAISSIYSFMLFPITFILMNWTRKELEIILHTVFVITTSGIFMMQYLGLNDYNELYRIQTMLRPEQSWIPVVTGIPQIGGYQASNHDAANIMVMICMYYFVQLSISCGMSRLLFVILFSVGVFALLLTASASNIIVFIGMLLLVMLLIQRGVANRILIIMLLGFLLLVAISVDHHYFDVLHFVEKIRGHSELEGEGMFTSLNLVSLIDSLPSLIIGFGFALNVPMIHSEVAFIKILFQYGIGPTLVLFYILFMPLHLLRRVTVVVRRLRSFDSQGHQNIQTNAIYEGRQRLFLLAAPILTGTMTLLHYGSLFRVTSIGLFCVVLAIFLKEYLAFMNIHKL